MLVESRVSEVLMFLMKNNNVFYHMRKRKNVKKQPNTRLERRRAMEQIETSLKMMGINYERRSGTYFIRTLPEKE